MKVQYRIFISCQITSLKEFQKIYVSNGNEKCETLNLFEIHEKKILAMIKSGLLIIIKFIHRNSRMIGFLITAILTSKEYLQDPYPSYFVSQGKSNKINGTFLIHK